VSREREALVTTEWSHENALKAFSPSGQLTLFAVQKIAVAH
jgi:hypothetical protein